MFESIPQPALARPCEIVSGFLEGEVSLAQNLPPPKRVTVHPRSVVPGVLFFHRPSVILAVNPSDAQLFCKAFLTVWTSLTLPLCTRIVESVDLPVVNRIISLSTGKSHALLTIYHNYAKIVLGGDRMDFIRPVSDLRNNFADISKTVHETAQPVFLTKNGYGDMVVMSMEAFEKLQFESEVYFKLKEAEREAELTDKRFSSKDVLKAMKDAIHG